MEGTGMISRLFTGRPLSLYVVSHYMVGSQNDMLMWFTNKPRE